MSRELKAFESSARLHESAYSGGSLAAAEATRAGLSDKDFLQEGVLPYCSDEVNCVAAEEGAARQEQLN